MFPSQSNHGLRVISEAFFVLRVRRAVLRIRDFLLKGGPG